jgi:hypothetical protein
VSAAQPALEPNTWLDALALFALDNGLGDFGIVDVGRRSDDQDLPAACIILTEVRGLVSSTMGWGNDVIGPYANLYVRGEPDDYLGPRNAVWRLMTLLHRAGQLAPTIHGFPFLMIGGDNAPTPNPLGRDEQRRAQWSVDVPVWLRVVSPVAPVIVAAP